MPANLKPLAKLNPYIFREYDIRGLVGKDLRPEVAEVLGKAYGTYIQKLSGKNICVGGDNRTSTDELKPAFIQGLLSTGCDVTDIGLSLSPMMYFAVCFYGFDGGANVTGSHNPAEFNGFKLTEKEARPVFGKMVQEIRWIAEAGKFAEGKGELSGKEIAGDYFKAILDRVKLPRKVKVVADAGNGIAGLYAPKLLRKLGCEVVELFCEPDSSYPNHLPDPEIEANMAELRKAVVREKAELGLGFDGDGDRIGIVDENGKYYTADHILLLLARDLLQRKPGAKVVAEVKCSQNLFDDIERHGGTPIIWKAGHSLIKQKMREENALLGGEVSGHMFFREDYYGFDDSFLAAARLLRYYVESGKKFSQLFEGLPKVFNTREIKVPCPDEKKFEVVEKVKQHFTKQYEAITVDGVRVLFGEGAWGLVRASNTNPYLTLRFEAKSAAKLRQIKEIVWDKLREFPEVALDKARE